MKGELTEAACYEVLRRVRWPNGTTCLYCGEGRVTIHSVSPRTPRRRYLCLGCRRTFTDLTGTPFARTNLLLGTWFRCLSLMRQGHSTSALAKELGVKWDTSALMQRRLRPTLARPGLLQQLREAGPGDVRDE